MTIKLVGSYTALITPFKSDTSIDWEAFDRLLELQIAGGITGVVPCGTTGESPTLSETEQRDLIARAVKRAAKRCQIIAGTGSNCTAKAIKLAEAAAAAGADAVMVVNPYYNKPTQEGLFRHFKAVAQSVQLPVVVYNIQGRTGVNVETPTLLRIIEACPNVLAVKEASGKLEQMKQVLAAAPKSFSVLSGDDNMTLDLLKAGGHGVISVVSNLVPARVVEFVKAGLSGDFNTAERLHRELSPLFEAAFIETNPLPIKAALAMQKHCLEVYRLPMCEMRPSNRERLEQQLKQLGLLN